MIDIKLINDTIFEFEDIPSTHRNGRINQALAALKEAREKIIILDAKNEALVAAIKTIVQND
jgi:hypothetical protein